MRFQTSRRSYQSYLGFTIVELLIVIVVIAVLATVTIIAYNGITDNAHNNTVEADLSNIAKRIEMLRTSHDSYPQGGYLLQSEGGGALAGMSAAHPQA